MIIVYNETNFSVLLCDFDFQGFDLILFIVDLQLILLECVLQLCDIFLFDFQLFVRLILNSPNPFQVLIPVFLDYFLQILNNLLTLDVLLLSVWQLVCCWSELGGEILVAVWDLVWLRLHLFQLFLELFYGLIVRLLQFHHLGM